MAFFCSLKGESQHHGFGVVCFPWNSQPFGYNNYHQIRLQKAKKGSKISSASSIILASNTGFLPTELSSTETRSEISELDLDRQLLCSRADQPPAHDLDRN
ncbi:hypothetical protein PGTUg99_005678 [Puccinia graminis f. sp. tritici]|uniref:Uncharacterized protein n=1 Tax=Puccinia graminis f. sp. tritici TaxID=56615 RepID=A0A5B0Q3J8_PUCGR|nr:hypothetical protein PGTUg99_005678 [Puccinia graminis f. sp. tritici]